MKRARAAGYKQEYDSDLTPFPHGTLVSGTKATVRAKPDTYPTQSAPNTGVLGSFKKGGKVRRTGLYKLHKGETVRPKTKKLAN